MNEDYINSDTKGSPCPLTLTSTQTQTLTADCASNFLAEQRLPQILNEV